jgi:DNA-binding transcriptional ArsR family regulator
MYYWAVARTPTTADVFNAIGDEHRRHILDTLGAREMAVGELVDALGITQPQVSKHLKVLRDVGLVQCDRSGRHRHYRVNGAALRPIHDWVRNFAALWNERYDRLDDLLVELKQEEER